MPCLYQVLARHNIQNHLPEDSLLLLPSQLDHEDLNLCQPGLAELEERLRDAQMRNSLDKLRIQLHIQARLINFKRRNVRHQRPNTRARKRLDVNDVKVHAFAEKYRAARLAKLRLSSGGNWENTWRPLMDGDTRTITSSAG